MERSMEERLARLEAAEDIRMLKAKYCALCDADYDPEGLAALFLPDAIWDGGIFGRHAGREAIRSFFKGISGTISFAAHLVLNPIIEVQGPDTATGKWRLIMPCTVAGDDGKPEARWLLSAYDESYARRDGIWYFSAMTVTNDFFAPHLKGWA